LIDLVSVGPAVAVGVVVIGIGSQLFFQIAQKPVSVQIQGKVHLGLCAAQRNKSQD